MTRTTPGFSPCLCASSLFPSACLVLYTLLQPPPPPPPLTHKQALRGLGKVFGSTLCSLLAQH
jgi:hypothetical protein